MKTLSAPALAALASGSVGIVQLVALDFTVPIYLNTSTWDLTWQRRVNLLAYSSAPDQWAPYTEGSAGLTVQVVTDPTYGLVVRLTKTAGAPSDRIGLAIGFTGLAGNSYTTSIFCKTNVVGTIGTSSYVDAQRVGGGLVTTTTPISSTIGVWERHSAVGVGPCIGTGNYYILVLGPIGSSIDVCMPQLEPGELATTYTPTTTTTINEPGVIYKGAYGLGTISAVQDKPGDISGITLELAAGSPAIIALALDGADEVQGTPCTIRTAIIDTNTYQILDAPVEWAGTLDTMSIGEDGTTAVVSVSAESKAVDLLRGTPRMYTDEEQTLINPADRCFKYVVDQADKPLIWPSRSYYQQ